MTTPAATEPPTYILGISAFYHDSAACLVKDGEVVAAAQEERFTRRKHDPGFPRRAIEYCLCEGGVAPEQLAHIAFYDKPWIKFIRLLETYVAFAPAGLLSFWKSMPLWLKQKFWIGELIAKELPWKGQLIFPEHHQSHAASAFFPSPFERAAIITMDGVGEWASASWGVGAGATIDVKFELRFPHSLGLLYSAFTYYTGFKVNSGEYKVMGLAPYGEPKYVDLFYRELIDLRADGSFRLNMDYFNYCQGLTMTSEKLHRLFGGPPRRPESQLTQKDMDIARSLQDVTEEVMLRTARHVRKETGEKNLCLAGGVALNCVGAGKVLRERIFDNIWIQPAAGDAGGALGAALFAWHQVLGRERRADGERDRQQGSRLGPAFRSDEIRAWLDRENLPYHAHAPEEIPAIAARLIADGKVVGWLSGRMEFGPRALGARSILADARSPAMQATLNLKIKHRESFRPLAPSVLLEDLAEYFEIDCPSPYMLLVAPVRREHRRRMTAEEERLWGIDKLNVPRSDVPAITHVDYSARIQSVDRRDHSQFHRLIEEFKKLTGCGLIVNTSFNVRGEPIVCTPQEAHLCFMRTGMDVLVLEDCVLFKEEQPPLAAERDWRGAHELD